MLSLAEIQPVLPYITLPKTKEAYANQLP